MAVAVPHWAPAAAPFRLRWIGLRNRLIAAPGFQRWARRLPLLRGVARGRAASLFDLTAGFVYSQVLLACVRLRLCDHLAAGPVLAATLAPRLDLPAEACLRLLRAAAALGLAEALPDGRFALGETGAALRGNPGVTAMIAHNALLYADLTDPVALLRDGGGKGQLAAFWGYAANPAASALPGEAVGPYSALMAQSQALIAAEVLAAYDLRRHRCLLDIGGGEGAFLCAAGEAAPALTLMLFDLPAVAARAEARLARAGLTRRATVQGGSFFTDSLPHGADIASLVRVLHDHDDEAAMALLRAAHAALPPGGTVLVAEPMAQTPGAERAGDAYFGFYLAAMGSGRPRPAAEIAGMLREAGFSAVRHWPAATPLIVRVMTARRVA